jgi:hypothetical protein
MLYHRRHYYRAAPGGDDLGCLGWIVLLFVLGFVAFHAAKFALLVYIVVSH